MNTLRTNNKLTLPDSEAYVGVEGQQCHVGSITVKNLVELLNQSGDTLIHNFNRLSANKEIVKKSYSFRRKDVVEFINSHVSDYAKNGISNEELINLLRNDINKSH